MNEYTFEEMGVQGKSVEELCIIGESFGVGFIVGVLVTLLQTVL